jgi:hypothetical protein
MPLKGNVRYRVKTTKTGKKIRLAFRNGKVIEAKKLEKKHKKKHKRSKTKRKKRK